MQLPSKFRNDEGLNPVFSGIIIHVTVMFVNCACYQATVVVRRTETFGEQRHMNRRPTDIKSRNDMENTDR